MRAAEVVAALDLPAAARVDRRVPKKLFIEHGARTAADRRRISDGIKRATWVAVLKPATIGVEAYRDDVREYLEIALLHLHLRPGAELGRLAELVHRAVPYPVFAVTEDEELVQLSLAHKRWSLNEVSKTVLDGPVLVVDLVEDGVDDGDRVAFLAALAVTNQPPATLWDLYQGWMDVLVAMQAARRTGTFRTAKSARDGRSRRTALEECGHLEAEIARLRSAAAKETQIARQVELNLELKRAEAALADALTRL